MLRSQRGWFLSLAVLLAASLSGAWETQEQRTARLLDSLSTRKVNVGQTDGPHRAGRTGFWTTEGRLTRGITNSTTWYYLGGAVADADGAGEAVNGGFSAWPGMDCWYRFNHLFPQSIKDQYRDKYTSIKYYHNGSTPNQKMMWVAGCNLACQVWGTSTVTQVSNADYMGTGDPVGRDYVISRCKVAVKQSFEERWAKHYLAFTLGPLRSLADYSFDPELRNYARMTVNWGLADLAPVNFQGRWAVPAGRGSMGGDGDTYDISEFTTWLLMGGPVPSGLLDADQSCHYIMRGAPNPTIPPELVDIGTNRVHSYTTRRLARLFETQFATTYMTPAYALYSEVEGDTKLNPDGSVVIKDLDNAGVPSNDWNSERWALFWDDGPDYAGAGLTMKPPTSYGWAVGTGLGPNEDVVQDEGTLVGVLNIPTNRLQYTRDSIPTNALAVINETATTGRLFLHYKTVLVAIYRTDPGNFQFPAPSSTFCAKRGFALETAAPAEYPQSSASERLAAFRDDILAHGGVNTNFVQSAAPRMIYKTRKGRVLDLTYGQAGVIDGAPVDYEAWPLSESPWTFQTQTGNMFVFGRDRTLLWNYKTWTESTNNRPVVVSSAPVASGGTNAVDVDVAARVSDAETASTNLQVVVLGASNGSATLRADGHTVRFTPAGDLAAASFTFSARDAFIDHRLVFHYDYEQTNLTVGAAVADRSTLERHATADVIGLGALSADSSVPAACAGQSRQSLRLGEQPFGGARLQRMIYSANVNLARADWTFSTWVKRDGFDDDDIVFYLGAGNGRGGAGEELVLNLPAQSARAVLRHYGLGGALDVDLVSPAAIASNRWHHLAVAFDGVSNTTGRVSLYLDGALAGSATDVIWDLRSLQAASPLVIGGPLVVDDFTRMLGGCLDETALYRGCLSGEEILRLATGAVAYTGGLAVTNTVSLLATPCRPTGLEAVPGYRQIALTWTAAPGAATYTVKRATAVGGPFATIVSGLTATAFTDSTVAEGTNYFYTVTAVNAIGTGVASVAVSTEPLPDSSVSDSAWSGGTMNAWSHGARLTLPFYTRSATLTNFPLLVTLDAGWQGLSYSQFTSPQGFDLRFTDASLTNVLAHEIETWDTNGTSSVWVKIPALTNGAAIYAFWGNPAATTCPATATNGAVWSGGYRGVWHFATPAATDSGAGAHHASANSATGTTGVVAGALGFDGVNDSARITTHADFNLTGPFEVQGWFRVAASEKPAAGGYLTFTSKEVDSANRNWWIAMTSEGRVWWKSSDNIDMQSAADRADGQWHHFAAVHEGSVARLYIDGVQAASDTTPGTVDTQSAAVDFGAELATRYFKGRLDEARVSAVGRSADWVWASWHSVASNATALARWPVSVNPGSSASIPRIETAAPAGVGVDTATLAGALTSTGGAPTSVWACWGTTEAGTNFTAWAQRLPFGICSPGALATNLTGLAADTAYAVRFCASNAFGRVWSDRARLFVTQVAAPTSPGFFPAAGRVGLSWSAVAGASGYTVRRRTAAEGPYGVVADGVLGTSYADGGAAPGVTNEYVVAALGAGGAGPDSAPVGVLPVAAPAALTAVGGNGLVALAWPPVAGATAYTVRRATSAAGPYATVQSNVTATNWNDVAVVNGSEYFYVVRANTPGFESADSVAAGVRPAAAPGAPAGLTVVAGDASASLAWNAVAGALTYTLRRSQTSGGPYTDVAQGLLAPSATDAGLVNGQTYYYVVAALNGAGAGAASAQVAVVPAIQPNSFTNTASGNWNGVVWQPNPPGKPRQSFTTTNVFNNGASVTSTNDLGAFVFNRLRLINRGVTLRGAPLTLVGVNPGIDATANYAHTVENAITLTPGTSASIAANTTTLSGALDGNGGLTKLGAGALVLSGTNTYAGLTTVSAGTLELRSPHALGSSAGATTVSSGATLALTGSITVSDEELTLNDGVGLLSRSGTNIWNGDLVANSGTTRIQSDAGLLRIAGGVNNSGANLLVLQGVGELTVDGMIDGDSTLTCSSEGDGLRTLAGRNTYTGATDINGGTLAVSTLNSVAAEARADGGSLGAPTTVAAGTITMGYSSVTARLRYLGGDSDETTDRVIDLAGSTGTIVLEQASARALTFASAFTATGAGSKKLSLIGSGTGTATIAGRIPNNSASNITSVEKNGSGTWVLAGTNSYTGATTIYGGCLVVGGVVTSAVTVSSSGGGTLRGSGRIVGNLTVSGGTLAPGDGIGTLTLDGGYTQAAAGTLRVTVDGADAGAQHDQLRLTAAAGTVSLAGNLAVENGCRIPTNTPFVVLDNGGPAAVSGAFAGKTNHAVFAAGEYRWRISYTGGDGNDVTLTAVEPSLTPPAAPSNLTAVAAGASRVDLAWTDASSDEVGFIVERREGDGAFVPIADLPAGASAFADTGTRHNRSHTYRVQAYRSYASLSAFSNEASAVTPDAPLAGSWMPVRFPGYDRAAPLTNFPVLVCLGTHIPGFDYAAFGSDQGLDLRFCSSDRKQDLNYEIENWDTNGVSRVWVQVPVLAAGCSILAGWGDAAEQALWPSQTNGMTWSQGFLGVWHLSETAGEHADSSPARSLSRVVQASEQGTAAGIVGGCDRFDGADNYVSLPDMGLWPQATVEAWVNLDAPPSGSYSGLVSSDTFSSSGETLFRCTDSLKLEAHAYDGATLATPTNTLPVGDWFYAGYTMDGVGAGRFHLFLDGTVRATGTGAASNDLTDVCLARELGGRYLAARLDEVRASSVARSTNWTWATWMTIASNAAFTAFQPVASGLPAAPALSATPTNGAVRLNWSATDGDAFVIRRGSAAGGPYDVIGTTAAQTWFDAGRINGVTNYYVVAATNIFGTGTNSAPVAVAALAPPSAPTAVTALGRHARVELTWDAAPGTEAYAVRRAASSGGPYTTLIDGLTETVYFDEAVTNGATYYYVVAAVNAGGWGGDSVEVDATPQLLADWPFKCAVPFTGYTRSEALTNFPALVVLGTNIANFSYGQFGFPGGTDLRFTDAALTRELAYEIETWNTNGLSYVWVQVPVLTNGSGVVAHWGDSAVLTPDYATDGSAWTEGFLGVWHLSEAAGPHRDSSPAHAASELVQATPQGVATGIVNGCDQFNGTNGYVDLPNLGTQAQVTVECWANLAVTPPDANRGLVSSDVWRAGVVHFRCNSSRQVVAALNGGAALASAAQALTVGSWFYAGYTLSGTNAGAFRLFLDGGVVTQAVGSASCDLTDVNIAREYNGRYLNARLDEVRVSSVSRSTNWIWATWQNIASNPSFNSYGAVINTALRPPAQTAWLTAVAGSDAITLDWASVADAAGYVVRRATAAGGPFVDLANTAVPTFTDATAALWTRYWYTVAATNFAGAGPTSTVANARLESSTITLTADDPGNTSSFNTAGGWISGEAPVAGSLYYTGAYQLRTPTNLNTSFTFAGERLTLNEGGSMIYKGSAGRTITVDQLVLAGGALRNGNHNMSWTLSGGAAVESASRFSFTQTNANTVVSAALSGTGGLYTAGASLTETLTLTGANSAWSGGLTFNGGGRLSLNSPTAPGTGPFTISASFGAATIDNNSATDVVITTVMPQRWAGDFTFAGTRSLNLGAGAVTLLANRTVTVTSNTLTIAGSVGESGGGYGLTKAGAGTCALAESNTFSGPVTVSGGELRVRHNQALGSTVGQSSVASGGKLSLDHAVSVSGETVTIAGGGPDFNGALQAAPECSCVWAGPVILGDSVARIGAGTNGVLTVSGAILGSGANQTVGISAGRYGRGTVVLAGSGSTYTGVTSIIRGTLKLGCAEGASTNAVLDVDSSSAAEPAVFDLAGFSQVVGGLRRSGGSDGRGIITNSGTSATLVINQRADATYSGSFAKGDITLVKQGAGTLTLSGTNEASGALVISQGTLRITQAAALSKESGIVLGTGVLDVSNASPVLAPATVSSFAGMSGTLRMSSADRLDVDGPMSGPLTILITDPDKLNPHQTYILATFKGSPPGGLALSGLTYPWMIKAESGLIKLLRSNAGLIMVL